MLIKIAALFTRISIRPKAFTVSKAIRPVSASSETSILIASARPPPALISLATGSPSRISAMTTAAPSSANLRAYAAPMWRAPPVTIATRPLNLTGPSRSIGVIEWWSDDSGTQYSSTLVLHYSDYSSESFQVLAHVDRLPPSFQSERLGDHPRGIVSRRAGNVAARMARRAA